MTLEPRVRPLRRLAALATELTSPTLLAPALLIAISISAETRHHRHALLWGLAAALFVGVIPLAFLKHGVRGGRWEDHHVRDRASRSVPLAVAAASVATGIALLAVGGAPNAITGLVVAMLAGLLAVLLISRWWKISIHASVAGGAAVVLAVVFGTTGLVLGCLLALTAGCLRVASRDHTPTQVVAGLGMGACAALLYIPLR